MVDFEASRPNAYPHAYYAGRTSGAGTRTAETKWVRPGEGPQEDGTASLDRPSPALGSPGHPERASLVAMISEVTPNLPGGIQLGGDLEIEGANKRPRLGASEVPPGLNISSPEANLAELQCDETLPVAGGETRAVAREITLATTPPEPLIPPPVGPKSIQVRARWQGLPGVWKYHHVPAERNSMCPHALSKHERGCYCGVNWEGTYDWKFIPDHSPLDPIAAAKKLPSATRYAPGYASLSKAVGWDPLMVSVPSAKGWLALAKYLVLLSKEGPPAIEDELAITLTGARWLVARHAQMCDMWLRAGEAEMNERGLTRPLQAPVGSEATPKEAGVVEKGESEGIYSIFSLPPVDLSWATSESFPPSKGASLLPARGIMAPDGGVPRLERESDL